MIIGLVKQITSHSSGDTEVETIVLVSAKPDSNNTGPTM